MEFVQSAPQLGNQFVDDRVLRSFLARHLPPEIAEANLPLLEAVGERTGGELYTQQLEERLVEPRLISFDPWGVRIDRIELTPLWQKARVLACEYGLVARAYERREGALSRLLQFSLAYLFQPATDVYNCPLAMTDGAAKTLLRHGNAPLVERALPRLTSRDPQLAWTSGQWMTEKTGGSDVGRSETVARRDGDAFRLFGSKWFTSAATSEMALTLARPEGNGPGGKGLALFYLETHDDAGRSNGITVHRLKEKLGTRKLPTAELSLDGTRAVPVVGLGNGVQSIAPMLNVTRTWNAICAVGDMRRAIALARDYGTRRIAFGAPLCEKPLFLETLAGLQAEFEAGFLLAFFAAELLGKEEAGELSAGEAALLRLVTPLAKLSTAKQSLAVTSEVIELFGGAGYIEDTGLPRLLRDTQVLSIWEGTTDVLSLEALRALRDPEALVQLRARIEKEGRTKLRSEALTAVEASARWLSEAQGPAREAGARKVALTLARALSLALLDEHAAWSLEHEKDGRAAAAARRFSRHGIDRLDPGMELEDARALARDERLA